MRRMVPVAAATVVQSRIRLPTTVASDIVTKYGKDQVIILTLDSDWECMSIVTAGKTSQDRKDAAALANDISKLVRYPSKGSK